MYQLSANFRPAKEPKNGYIGKADITISDSIRINNVSVFENGNKMSLAFGTYGKDKKRSYVIPASTEAYAAMLVVVDNAIHSENNVGFMKGDVGVHLEVDGDKVKEPYADGRYSIKVGDFCILKGIRTREVPFEKDGKPDKFVAVDLPVVRDESGKVSMYKDKEGKEHANLQFEGLTVSWTNKEGKDVKVDYAQMIEGKVRAKRKELMEPTLDDKIADGAKEAQGKAKKAPDKAKDTPNLDVPF